eukprot:GEMP01031029.1.p1 GENE.GEMP01031029.1~~GEMP01031029.1.p1  ORF type:complete len:288 (+),score=70.41 GEMP01031029.1:92-955(+)
MGCIQSVPEDRRAIITRFGKYDRIAEPGLLCLWCPCVHYRAGDLSIRLQETVVRVETKTKDNVFVNMEVAIQYEVIPERVYDAFYRLSDTNIQISSYVFDVVRAAVPRLFLDDVFMSKDEIAASVRDELLKEMDVFGYRIVASLITDITPNARVKDSMNEINAAVRGRVAAKEKAETEKIMLVKQAEADAESKFLQGQGIARQRKAIVDGLRDSVGTFTSGDSADLSGISAKDVLELVLVTQYFDTMKDVGASSKSKTVFVPNNPGAMGELSNEIRQGFLHARAARI